MEINNTYTNKAGHDFIVIDLLPKRKILIEWVDSYAHQMVVSKDNAVRGAIRNPYKPSVYGEGFIGVGPYRSSREKSQSKIHMIWRNILQRCYGEKFRKENPTYSSCTIHPEWKNLQVFGAWYEENYIPDCDLDKDLLIRNNKHYSPETCAFLPCEINTALIRADVKRGKLPIGVSWHKPSRKYIAQASNSYLGTYLSIEEAFLAYKVFKEQSLKILAKQYQHIITPSAYSALINYEVIMED